jgi:hypothetical protein
MGHERVTFIFALSLVFRLVLFANDVSVGI